MLNIYERVAIEEARHQCWIYVCYRIMHARCGIPLEETRFGPGGKVTDQVWEFVWEENLLAAYEDGLRPFETLAKMFSWDKSDNWWIDFAAHEEQQWQMENGQHGNKVANTGHVALAI